MPSPNVERWRDLVARYFPTNVVDSMLRIMELESGGNPAAHNPGTAEVPEDSWGLFQINRNAWGGSAADWSDPERNVRQAAEILRVQGFDAWHNARVQLQLPLWPGGPRDVPVPGMPQPGQPSGPGPAPVVPIVPLEPPRLPDIGAGASDIISAVNRLGDAIAQLPVAPVAYVQNAAETLTWLGQTNIWLRVGLLLLGAVVVVIGLVLFALSFAPKGAAKAAVRAVAAA